MRRCSKLLAILVVVGCGGSQDTGGLGAQGGDSGETLTPSQTSEPSATEPGSTDDPSQTDGTTEAPGGTETADGSDTDDGQPIVCALGTTYPGVPLIDPDDPVFSDENWTQEEVTDAFASAKEGNTKAYVAYVAALEHEGVLDCAFCPCGCKSSASHKSAIDCFKDMHAFT